MASDDQDLKFSDRIVKFYDILPGVLENSKMLLGGSGRYLVAATWNLAAPVCCQASQFTGTYVLKRRNAPLLNKRLYPEGSHRPLRRRHKIYDTIERPGAQPLPNIDIILTQYVEGLGKPGDTVSVKVTKAHNDLLSFGRAVYASPENIEKYKNVSLQSASDEVQHSSIYSTQTVKVLSRQVLAVTMNMEEPWTLEPWHLRVAFRKAGFVVRENCIEMPARPIQGPDVDGLEGKEFVVVVTVNGLERVPVRCRLHHYATDPRDRLPFVQQPWLRPAEPVFPEDAERLTAIPLPAGRPDDADH